MLGCKGLIEQVLYHEVTRVLFLHLIDPQPSVNFPQQFLSYPFTDSIPTPQ